MKTPALASLALALAALLVVGPARARAQEEAPGGTDLVLVVDASTAMAERDRAGARVAALETLVALADERVRSVAVLRFAGWLETEAAGEVVVARTPLAEDPAARGEALRGAFAALERGLAAPIGEGCDWNRAAGGAALLDLLARARAEAPRRQAWVVFVAARDTFAAIESRGRIREEYRRQAKRDPRGPLGPPGMVPPETVALEILRERTIPALQALGPALTFLLVDPPGASRIVSAPVKALSSCGLGSEEVISLQPSGIPLLAVDALRDAPPGTLASLSTREIDDARGDMSPSRPLGFDVDVPRGAARSHLVLAAEGDAGVSLSVLEGDRDAVRVTPIARGGRVVTLEARPGRETPRARVEMKCGAPVAVRSYVVRQIRGRPVLEVAETPPPGRALEGRAALVGPDGAPLATEGLPPGLEAELTWSRGAARATETQVYPPLAAGRAEARFRIPLPEDAPLGEYRLRARFRALPEAEDRTRMLLETPPARASRTIRGAPPAKGAASVVLVLDASGSMRQYDPRGASIEAAGLVSALVENGEGLASVVFSSAAEENGPLRAIRSSDDRRAFAAELDGLPRGGETNFVAALRSARAAIQEAGGPPRGAIVFLTDGEHNTGGDEAAVQAEVEAIRALGVSVHAIAYGPEGRTPLLASIAARTGGAVHVASDARAVLEAYVRITGHLEDLFITRDPRPVRLLPGTERLVTVVLKGSPATRLAALTRDGAPVALEGAKAHRYPASGAQTRTVEAVRLEDPAPGVYAVSVEGPHEIGMTLCRTAHTFEFEGGAPALAVPDGDEQRVTLVVRGPAARRAFAAARAEARVDRLDGSRVAELALSADEGAEPDAIRFRGRFTAKAASPGATEQHIVAVTLRVSAGETEWTHDCRTSYRLLPPGSPRDAGPGATPPAVTGTAGTAGATGGTGSAGDSGAAAGTGATGPGAGAGAGARRGRAGAPARGPPREARAPPPRPSLRRPSTRCASGRRGAGTPTRGTSRRARRRHGPSRRRSARASCAPSRGPGDRSVPTR